MPGEWATLVTKVDNLQHPTGTTERDLLASKSPSGACLTVLIPCLIAAFFTVQYFQNLAAPNVSTTTSVDLSSLSPMSTSLTCVPNTALGSDPACPSSDYSAATMGFQFVDHLQSSSGGTCSSRARTSRSSRAWASANPRGLLEAYIALGGLSTYLTSAQQAALPKARTTYGNLLSALGVKLDDLWSGAGTPLTAGPASQPLAGEWSAFLQASPSTSQLNPLSAITADVAAGATQDTLTTTAASRGSSPVSFGPFPACPFPRVSSTRALAASPATAGVGYLAMLIPGFNWTASGRRELLVDTSAALGVARGGGVIHVPIVPPAASATGDELHDLWSAFAQQYSLADDAAPRFPYVEYSVDLVRTTDNSVSPPTVTVTGQATPFTGMLRHIDVLDMFGFPAHVTALAECGELFSLTSEQLLSLYDIAQVRLSR